MHAEQSMSVPQIIAGVALAGAAALAITAVAGASTARTARFALRESSGPIQDLSRRRERIIAARRVNQAQRQELVRDVVRTQAGVTTTVVDAVAQTVTAPVRVAGKLAGEVSKNRVTRAEERNRTARALIDRAGQQASVTQEALIEAADERAADRARRAAQFKMEKARVVQALGNKAAETKTKSAQTLANAGSKARRARSAALSVFS